MDYYSLPDKAIEAELGRRIKALRLNRNVTQKQLAGAANLSLNTVKSLESGRGKFASVVAVLRVLGALESIDGFIRLTSTGPLQPGSTQAMQRKRATGIRRGHRSGNDPD